MFGSGPNRVMVGEKRTGRINDRLCAVDRKTGQFSVILMKGLRNLRILDRQPKQVGFEELGQLVDILDQTQYITSKIRDQGSGL